MFLTFLGCSSLSAFMLESAAAPQSTLPPKVSSGQQLFLKAKQCVGREMWRPGYGLANGTLGCAAAVSNVFKANGNQSVHSAVVTVMRRQLLAPPNLCQEFVIRNGEGKSINDAVLLKNSQPGDILLAFMEAPSKINGGPNAHCGVMGVGTQVFTNNWLDGIWTEVEIHQMFDYYPYVRLLRLPQVRSNPKR